MDTLCFNLLHKVFFIFLKKIWTFLLVRSSNFQGEIYFWPVWAVIHKHFILSIILSLVIYLSTCHFNSFHSMWHIGFPQNVWVSFIVKYCFIKWWPPTSAVVFCTRAEKLFWNAKFMIWALYLCLDISVNRQHEVNNQKLIGNMEFKFMILHKRWSMKQTWITMPHSRHSGRYLSPCCAHILQRRAKIEVLVTSFGKYWVISNRTILLTISIVCESKRLEPTLSVPFSLVT